MLLACKRGSSGSFLRTTLKFAHLVGNLIAHLLLFCQKSEAKQKKTEGPCASRQHFYYGAVVGISCTCWSWHVSPSMTAVAVIYGSAFVALNYMRKWNGTVIYRKHRLHG